MTRNRDSDITESVRFGGVRRLFGSDGFDRIRRSHVMVVGIGGVGSWAVEMLARSGVGGLSLVDLDDVCESNINRQVHALDSTIGKPKIEAMANRVQEIHPGCSVRLLHTYLTASTCDAILGERTDWVFDAIDSLRHKITLLLACRERSIPLLISGGAGGLRDPGQLRIEDLSRSKNDPLLQKMRKQLRREHHFPRDTRRKFGVDCVYSTELSELPLMNEEVCAPDPSASLRLDCASGYGTAGFVTAAFGNLAAARILNRIAEG